MKAGVLPLVVIHNRTATFLPPLDRIMMFPHRCNGSPPTGRRWKGVPRLGNAFTCVFDCCSMV